jgi:peptide/nickel transport system ATP-binding protein
VKVGVGFDDGGLFGEGETSSSQGFAEFFEAFEGLVGDGQIRLDGRDLVALEGVELRHLRRRMQIIFQDPYSSLNPRIRAGAIVREPMDLMDVGEKSERDGKVAELFRKVGLRPEQQALFPHQFSGGQRQRIGVARALASQPDLVVCDEPVSALDVAIQGQIINLLRGLQDEFGLTYMFISHDLGVVQHVCDEIAVMYLGQIVEQADRISLFVYPLHPYTWALISAVPKAEARHGQRSIHARIEGEPPSPIDPPAGCRFSGRCPFAERRCRSESPPLRPIRNGHLVACHLVEDDGSAPHRRAGSGGSG